MSSGGTPPALDASRASPGFDFGAALAGAAEAARNGAWRTDRDAAFPADAIAALRRERLLGALVPTSLGGLGLSLADVAAACCALGRACSSTGMVFAMHQIQVACLVAHAGNDQAGNDQAGDPWHRAFMEEVASRQLLLASVTSEAGVGGDIRTSRCAVVPAGEGRIRVEKAAPSISYGRYADALLVTARRDPAAEPSDQVLVVARATDCALDRRGEWDAMGMRGTATEPFHLVLEADAAQAMPTPYGEVASRTMLPVSHLLWASLWVGIAADAVERTRAFLRAAMRGKGGAVPAGATGFAEAVELLQLGQARVQAALGRYTLGAGDGGLLQVAGTADVNALKSGTSDLCLQVVQRLLHVAGFAGYRNDGEYSLSRHLRDLHSAPLMVHNDRIRDATAKLLLARLPQLGIG